MVCSSSGTCTAFDTCACNICTIGTFCEDEFCLQKTSLNLVSVADVFSVGSSLNITVAIGRQFSAAGQAALRCRSSSTVFDTIQLNSTHYLCTITSMTQSVLNVGMYIGSVQVTSNTITVHAIQQGFVTKLFA